MKSKAILLFFLCLSLSLQATNLRLIFNYKSFYHPQSGNYVETYLQFLSSTVNYKKVDGHYQGEVEIQMVISKNDTVKAFDHYRLKSNAIGDTIFADFYSVKRFNLPAGEYLFEMYAFDINTPADTIKHQEKITIRDFKGDIQFSDVELIDNAIPTDKPSDFFKSGYDIFPKLLNYYSNDDQKIIFYDELYNTNLLGDSSRYLIKYYISDAKTDEVLSDYLGVKRITAEKVVPFIQIFDIENLPSGEYYLVLELYDEHGELLRSKKNYFDRYNVITDLVADAEKNTTILDPAFHKSVNTDSIFYYMASLVPISSGLEEESIKSITKKRDTILAKKYFQAYWKKSSPTEPTQAWLKYKKLITSVEENYGTPQRAGFDTDRGRIFLKYGVPNTVNARPNDPNQYPYEIWQYYKLEKRNNVRFIFYNPKMIGNDYMLLHSDLPSERYNSDWQTILNRTDNNNGEVNHVDDQGILNSKTNW